MIFTSNGEYLVSGGDGIQVWRVEDAKQIATMKARNVLCLAVSNDGRWIAAGAGRLLAMSLYGTQRHTSKYHTQGRFLGHLCSRFLARFDSTRDGLEQLQSRCLGCHTSQTNTDTPPRRYGESGEILAARWSVRDSRL